MLYEKEPSGENQLNEYFEWRNRNCTDCKYDIVYKNGYGKSSTCQLQELYYGEIMWRKEIETPEYNPIREIMFSENSCKKRR